MDIEIPNKYKDMIYIADPRNIDDGVYIANDILTEDDRVMQFIQYNMDEVNFIRDECRNHEFDKRKNNIFISISTIDREGCYDTWLEQETDRDPFILIYCDLDGNYHVYLGCKILDDMRFLFLCNHYLEDYRAGRCVSAKSKIFIDGNTINTSSKRSDNYMIHINENENEI